MALDFELLARQISAAAKVAFTEVLTQHHAEGIYSFALYSDEGAMTVCPAINTLDHLATQPAEDHAYYKFEPAEWKYEMVGAEALFNEISRLVRTEVLAKAADEEWFVRFRKQLFDTCLDVLARLQQESFFRNAAGREVFLLFAVSDYEAEPAELAKQVRRLNDNAYRDEYLAWLRTWEA